MRILQLQAKADMFIYRLNALAHFCVLVPQEIYTVLMRPFESTGRRVMMDVGLGSTSPLTLPKRLG